MATMFLMALMLMVMAGTVVQQLLVVQMAFYTHL